MTADAVLAIAKRAAKEDMRAIALDLARRGYDAEVIWRTMHDLAREAAVFAIVWAAHEDARQEELAIAADETVAGIDLAQALREAGAA